MNFRNILFGILFLILGINCSKTYLKNSNVLTCIFDDPNVWTNGVPNITNDGYINITSYAGITTFFIEKDHNITNLFISGVEFIKLWIGTKIKFNIFGSMKYDKMDMFVYDSDLVFQNLLANSLYLRTSKLQIGNSINATHLIIDKYSTLELDEGVALDYKEMLLYSGKIINKDPIILEKNADRNISFLESFIFSDDAPKFTIDGDLIIEKDIEWSAPFTLTVKGMLRFDNIIVNMDLSDPSQQNVTFAMINCKNGPSLDDFKINKIYGKGIKRKKRGDKIYVLINDLTATYVVVLMFSILLGIPLSVLSIYGIIVCLTKYQCRRHGYNLVVNK